MPYIGTAARDLLDDGQTPVTPGELNYVITRVCDEYIVAKGLSYSAFNDVIGALEAAKLELYRRLVAPYEDAKEFDNGDVYSNCNLTEIVL